MLLGWLLGPLAASWEALGASWTPLGGILGHLGSLLAASWNLLAASWGSWRPLGCSWRALGSLLAASWGLLGRLGLPGSGKVALAAAGARFFELPRRLLGGKVALARARAGFSGLPKIHGGVWPGGRPPSLGGSRPPLKLLAKAKSDTIMSLLAN